MLLSRWFARLHSAARPLVPAELLKVETLLAAKPEFAFTGFIVRSGKRFNAGASAQAFPIKTPRLLPMEVLGRGIPCGRCRSDPTNPLESPSAGGELRPH
jgi:hypothetical protein